MLEELNQQGRSSSASLVQCVRTKGHAAFAAKLHRIVSQYQYTILTREDPLSKAHLDGKLNADTHIYVAGSEAFLTMAENALAGFNHPKS